MEPEDRRARRERHAVELRRRRLLALGALTAVIARSRSLAARRRWRVVAPSCAGEARSASRGARAREDTPDRRAQLRPAGIATTPAGPPGHRARADPHVPRDRARRPPALRSRACTLTPAEFAAQMQALKRAGWHAVTLDQVEANWREGMPLGAGQADRGELRQRLPVAVHAGAAGPAPARLGRRGEHPAERPAALAGRPPADAQIRGLVAAGWELDTQGIQPRRPDHARRAASCTTRWPSRADRSSGATTCRSTGSATRRPLRRDRDRRRARPPATRLDDRRAGLGARGRGPLRLHRLRVLGGTTPAGAACGDRGRSATTRRPPPPTRAPDVRCLAPSLSVRPNGYRFGVDAPGAAGTGAGNRAPRQP